MHVQIHIFGVRFHKLKSIGDLQHICPQVTDLFLVPMPNKSGDSDELGKPSCMFFVLISYFGIEHVFCLDL